MLKCPSNVIPKRQVCGSDGLTYPSICHLRKRACEKGKAIPLAYKGPCKCKLNSFKACIKIKFINLIDGATCSKVRCRDQQICLNDLDNRRPRCVTCSYRCKPRHLNGPICGTNNSTYQSWCHMMQDSCSKGYVIETKHSGKCVSLSVSTYTYHKSSILILAQNC